MMIPQREHPDPPAGKELTSQIPIKMSVQDMHPSVFDQPPHLLYSPIGMSPPDLETIVSPPDLPRSISFPDRPVIKAEPADVLPRNPEHGKMTYSDRPFGTVAPRPYPKYDRPRPPKLTCNASSYFSGVGTIGHRRVSSPARLQFDRKESFGSGFRQNPDLHDHRFCPPPDARRETLTIDTKMQGPSTEVVQALQDVSLEASRDSKRQGRNMMTKNQSALLNQLWNQTYFPDTDQRTLLAEEADLSPRQVQVWFQNQRQKQRRILNSPRLGELSKLSDIELSPVDEFARLPPNLTESGAGGSIDYRKDLRLDGRAIKANRSAPDETKMRRLPPIIGSSRPDGGRSYSTGDMDRSLVLSILDSEHASPTDYPIKPWDHTLDTSPVYYHSASPFNPLSTKIYTEDRALINERWRGQGGGATYRIPRIEQTPQPSTVRLPGLAELGLPGIPKRAFPHLHSSPSVKMEQSPPVQSRLPSLNNPTVSHSSLPGIDSFRTMSHHIQ